MRVYSYTTKEKPSKSTRPKRTKFKLAWPGWKKFFTWTFRLFALGVIFAALLFLYYSKDMPDPNKLLDRQVPESTKIYARDGSLLYEIHGEYKRTLVNLDQIPPNLQHATIAIEDKNFYHEGGVSLTGIARAALADILTLRKSQGASTITQQFVRQALLSTQKSWDRKIREAILAIAMDARFSKDQILQFYLNEVPYGRNTYGVEAAAETYFGKHVKDLDLAECSYLAALPQAPTYYNPSGPHRDALDARKNTVLEQMASQGYITQDQAKEAENEKVAFSTINTGIVAPHFVFFVEDYLANKYGESTLEEGGLQVYTTLDPKLQQIAESVVKTDVDKESTRYNAHNAALVAVDPKTGQILAMVGSKDYFGTPEPAGCTPGKNCWFEPNVNVALSQRQPGSSFKPYVYGTAFKRDFKYNPASMLIDVTTNFGTYNGKDYIPQNYNGQSYGPVSMRQALAGSLNVPAVKTLALVGVNNAVQTARDLGITSPLADCGLSLVLGGCEVRLLDHVAAYSVIANEGVRNPATAILKVEDKNGQILEQFQSNPQAVLDPEAAYELISVMTDNNARSFVFGQNSPLTLSDRPVAAKTGTTQNWHDGWTLGFTPSLAAGVWAGNNDGTLLKKGADGVVVAAPIWHDFMQQALASTTPEAFPVPDGIQQVTVDSLSGLLPTDASPSTKTEVFADYSVPTQYDNVHQKIAFDSQTGQPATNLTPPGNIIYKVYTVLHSERPSDPNWENPVETWAQTNGYPYPPTGSTPISPSQPPSNNGDFNVNILQPSDGTVVSQIPLKITISTVSPNPVSRVDLYMDGQFVSSLTAAPYLFDLNQHYPDGPHTLAVKAVDNTGATADTSAQVTYALSTPLSIQQPDSRSPVNFPASVIAVSANLYNEVKFFYQTSGGQTKLIGTATAPSRLSDQYQYFVNWASSPGSGTYKIYAQTDTGITTPKVTITVP
ncbi:MAG: PBP1A family penicillin-binding protein [Patescibacteria group bacterium]|nr:PBP1A family penicillin-binding protein [Patescibacteria group bacterium]